MSECITSSPFLEAVIDYRYLLDRGYSQKSSLDIVVSRYRLSKLQRSLLYRCVHTSRYALEIKSKIASSSHIYGKILIIDLLNSLTTILSSKLGNCIYLCDDGIIRDVEGSRGWVRLDNYLEDIIEMLTNHIRKLNPKSVTAYIDRSVSWSGRILKLFIDTMSSKGIETSGETCGKTDVEIISTLKNLNNKAVVSTSDILILSKAHSVIDIPHMVVKNNNLGVIDDKIYRLLLDPETALKHKNI